jgi:hypothetical protein
MPAETPDLMKPEQLAAEWQLTRRTLDNWRYLGVGPPYVKLNGAVRYSRKACARWLAEQEMSGTGGSAA